MIQPACDPRRYASIRRSMDGLAFPQLQWRATSILVRSSVPDPRQASREATDGAKRHLGRVLGNGRRCSSTVGSKAVAARTFSACLLLCTSPFRSQGRQLVYCLAPGSFCFQNKRSCCKQTKLPVDRRCQNNTLRTYIS